MLQEETWLREIREKENMNDKCVETCSPSRQGWTPESEASNILHASDVTEAEAHVTWYEDQFQHDIDTKRERQVLYRNLI